MALELVVALLLVAANGFFVATEFALARLRPTQVDEWERQRRPGAGAVRHGVDHIDAYLAACQLGITLASLGLGVVGEPVFHDLLEPLLGDAATVAGVGLAAAVAFFLITMLHVVVGELAPKSLAIARTQGTALLVAPPMRMFYLVTRPLVDLFNFLGNLLLKPFGVPPAREAGHAPHSEEELHALVRQSSEEGVLEREERRLTERALEFDERRAHEVMRPRPEIAALHVDDDAAATLARARDTGYTRFPLVPAAGSLDGAESFVHVKDLILAGDGARPADHARPLPRVPAHVALTEVLRHMRRERSHMALVVDEHGTAVGLVTLEDLLEELVGEIEDEFDPDRSETITREGDALLVDGGATLAAVSERLGVAFADPHEATVGGLIVARLGRLPDEGEVVEVADGVRAEVLDVADGRLRSLRVPPRAA